MANPNLSQIVSDAIVHAFRTTEMPSVSYLCVPFDGSQHRTPYRDYLDRVQINWYGEPIPRIEVVKRNIAALGKPRKKPRLPD